MEKSLKKQITVRIDIHILDKIKDIVYWDPHTSLNEFIEVALQQAANNFGSIQKRPCQNLKSGRRIS